MPKLGLTMTEGTITEWRIQPGEAFSAGQIVAVVETEKIANELEAPSPGVMSKHLVEGGQTVPVGTPIAQWELEGGDSATKSATNQKQSDNNTRSATQTSSPRAQKVPTGPSLSATPPVKKNGSRIIATPLARRLARDRGIDLSRIQGTGPNGRIKAQDLAGADAAVGTKAASGPGVSSFIMTLATGDEVLALLSKLAGMDDAGDIQINHVGCMAIAKALESTPEANVLETTPGRFETGDTENINVKIMGGVHNTAKTISGANGLTLRGIAATAAKTEDSETLSSATAVTDLGADEILAGALALPNGCTTILAIGAPQHVYKPDADGQPALMTEIGLTLTFNPVAIPQGVATTLLKSIKGLLENPLRLLAG